MISVLEIEWWVSWMDGWNRGRAERNGVLGGRWESYAGKVKRNL